MARRRRKTPYTGKRYPERPVGWCSLHGKILSRYWAYEVKRCLAGPCKHFHELKKED